MGQTHDLDDRTRKSTRGMVAIWAVVAAFGTYFCMYAFRKPFTAGSYADATLWGLDYKAVLVAVQVTGYMISKFIGIKVIAEMPPRWRTAGILLLIGVAELALVLFGAVPPPYNFPFLFVNGLMLGMIFGLVLGFLEGRRVTEALTAGLCASFILADGVVKSVGTWLLQNGVPEYWMPAATGLVFTAPLLLSVWMLSRVPPPDADDETERTARVTLKRAERWAFLRRHAAGLIPLVLMYTFVTILRSIRADFAPELWRGLGVQLDAQIFARSEMWVALGVLLINGSAALIRSNLTALRAALLTSLGGFVLVAAALAAVKTSRLGGFAFMVLVGLGLYLPYVAVHTTAFERLIATTRDRANIGFLMYVADAFGYLAYVALMFSPKPAPGVDGLLGQFIVIGWIVIALSAACVVQSWRHLRRSAPPQRVASAAAAVD